MLRLRRDTGSRLDGRRLEVRAQARRFWRGARQPVSVAVVGGRARVPSVPRGVPVHVVDSWEAALQVDPGRDLVVLSGGARPRRGWLAALQLAAHRASGWVVGPLLLHPDGAIASGGIGYGAPGAHHRFGGRPAGWPPAQPLQPALGLDGACLYVSAVAREALGDRVASPAELCAGAWEAGGRVLLCPAGQVVAPQLGEPVVHGPLERSVGTPPRAIYVTQDTGVGGGHRVVFQHLTGLAERGFACELWTLDAAGPDWFDLGDVPVRRFGDYPALARELAPIDALKVGTWWETIPWVWEASVRRGVGVAFVQDLETSYYGPDHRAVHADVLSTFRPELAIVTTSGWVTEAVLPWAGEVHAVVPPGLDPWRLAPRPEAAPGDRAGVVALGRSNPLKDFPLTRAAYLALPEPRPALTLFGIEPELASGLGDAVRYVERPSDEEVDALLRSAAVLLLTSRHEGFCLPILEAMAAGAAVVCTDAHGNSDFCLDDVNCLMPSREPEEVAAALRVLLADPGLRGRLVREGRRTAEEHAWPVLLDRLEGFYRELAAAAATGSRPRPVRSC